MPKRRKMKQATLPGVSMRKVKFTPMVDVAPVHGLTRQLQVRLTPDEYAMVRRAALEQGRSAATFLRRAALHALDGILVSMNEADRKAWKREATRIVVGGVA